MCFCTVCNAHMLHNSRQNIFHQADSLYIFAAFISTFPFCRHLNSSQRWNECLAVRSIKCCKFPQIYRQIQFVPNELFFGIHKTLYRHYPMRLMRACVTITVPGRIAIRPFHNKSMNSDVTVEWQLPQCVEAIEIVNRQNQGARVKKPHWIFFSEPIIIFVDCDIKVSISNLIQSNLFRKFGLIYWNYQFVWVYRSSNYVIVSCRRAP